MKEFDKTNPFKTPNGYFGEFGERLSDRLKAKTPLIPKNDGFRAPEGYFDGLNKKIRQELNVETAKVIPLKAYKKYILAAASVAVIALFLWAQNRYANEKVGFEDLAGSEIDTYFEANGVGLSTYEIAEVLPVEELEINDILTTRIDEENMLDYLDENLNDFEELYLEDDE